MSIDTTTTATGIPVGTWEIDPYHTVAGFSVRHAGIANVRGRFQEVAGAIEVRPDGTVTGAGTARAASVDTGVDMRDDHLRSGDFFDAENHPELTLRATRIDASDPEDVRVSAELTIRGTTRPVELRGEYLGTEVDPDGDTRIGLELRGQVSRGDFGLRWNQALGSGNVLVGDKVKLALDVSAVKRA